MIREKNILLARDDIGRAKPSVYSLPTDTHIYGVKNKYEEFGVAKLTSSWHLPPITEQKIVERDFRKMNVMGVDAKITKPKQVREFRSHLDVLLHKPKGSKPVSRAMSIDRFKSENVITDPRVAAAAHSFGKVNRTQTPMKGIINGNYGIEAEQYYR
mmetsp:Transcript_25549/g.34154  ORF Transcript_25549/g.34154 Transcript_25549/m.34154 type:complete len:157 (+) Transcript_25549:35-505(+)